jgi:integrase
MAYYLRTRKTTDGSIGEWQCVHHRPHPSIEGRRVTRSKTFGTKTYETRTKARQAGEAWGRERDRLYASDPHSDPDAAKQSFATLAEAWLNAKKPKLKPMSYKRVDQILSKHLLPHFGRAEVGAITFTVWQSHLEKLAAETKGDGTPQYAANTIRRVHSVMTSVMERARQRGMIAANPCRGAVKDVVGSSEALMILLTPKEVLAVADAMPERYRLPVLTAGLTGVRANELWALQRQDVDLIKRRITVQRSIIEWRDRKPVFGTTKTNRKRVVPIPAQLLDVLSERMGEIPNKPSALVFTNDAGTAVSHLPFYKSHFKPAVTAALTERETLPRFHDLRHSYVSTLIARGVNVKTVATLAGHASPVMTLERYSHLFPETVDEAASQLDAAYAAAAQTNVVELKAAS